MDSEERSPWALTIKIVAIVNSHKLGGKNGVSSCVPV